MTDPLLLFGSPPLLEQQVVTTGEGMPGKERLLYSVPPGQSSSDQGPDRNNKPCLRKAVVIVGGIAVLALAIAAYAAVKK